MDQKDLYNQLKNAFLLGNYHKVFEFLKTYPLEEQNLLYKEDICCLIARSFIALEERKTSEIESFMNGSPDLKKMLNFLFPYLVPLLKDDVDNNKIMNSLEDLSKENFNISKMLYGYFGLKTMNYKLGKQISLDNSNNQLEMNLILILLLIKMNCIEAAKNEQIKMSTIDDEDLATHIARIYILIAKGQLEEAVFLIDETKEKFQDSIKLLNLKASCLIGLKQYDNAKSLLEKLLNILNNKEQYKDRQEIDICLHNLIAVNTITGASNEEYFKQLSEESLYTKKYNTASKLFDSSII